MIYGDFKVILQLFIDYDSGRWEKSACDFENDDLVAATI